jgi:hypothetical protein
MPFVGHRIADNIDVDQLFFGGKMILIESCLSYVPNYGMGVFHLKGEAHHKMETARSNFFLAWSWSEEKVPHDAMGGPGYP